jgi:DNA repair exonuclease SbcCD ATPase subunit
MKIQSIEWRNFSSYGNNLQKIVFEEEQGNFYLVVGSNGAGKSTISDVIKFGLYGKLDNKKLGEIANRFNGNAYVKIALQKNSTTNIIIERGIAPGIFRVYVNGIEYQQAGKKNIQAFLEEEVLEIPYYVFNNMVSLSINDFKSFISMSPHDKRSIVDRLFGLEVLGHIRWRIKLKVKEIRDQIENVNTEISVLGRSINNSNQELETLNAKLLVASNEKKAELLDAIEKLQAFIGSADTHIEKIKETLETLRIANSGLQQTKTTIEYERKSRQEKIELFQKGKCPTCESDLSGDYYQNLLQDYLTENEDAIGQINELVEKERDVKEKFTALETKLREVETKKTAASLRIGTAKTEISKMNDNSDNDAQTESLQRIIKESETKKEDAVKKVDNEEKKVNFYKLVDEVFGDKGVKLMAIKRILPILNSEIKKVLSELNMDYRVTFNEEFEVSIQHLGFPVRPEQLSTGERKKVDFAALAALIRIMKMKFTGVNLTFLDEIFSSIDSDGIYHILKVLHRTCRELNLNIFVINHSQLPTEIFDYRIEIAKNNGFSNLAIEKIG